MSSVLAKSLSGRLLLASSLLLPIFVVASGTALDRAFSSSQQLAEQERLRTQIYLLLGAADVFGEELLLPEQFQEPRFNQLESGLYGRILHEEKVLWRSPSSLLAELPPASVSRFISGQEVFQETVIGSAEAYALSFDVSWDTESGGENLYRFQVFHDQSSLKTELNNYRKQLWRSLGTMTIALLVIQWSIQRWGLQPLSNLAMELRKLQRGENLTMNESYPQEIQPVIKSLNQVLSAEREQRDRYRHTLSDLAHSLKTPLAVIRSNLDDPGVNAELLNDQVSRMDDIVRHQLQRAVGRTSAINRIAIPVAQEVDRLISAMEKVYSYKSPKIINSLTEDIYFFGEKGDLLELLGNLLDNACKYTEQRVEVQGEFGDSLTLHIDDDGPGIDPALRGSILNRGSRADTAQSGQGIGLAVVTDIVSSYRGALAIAESPMGGARFSLELPLHGN